MPPPRGAIGDVTVTLRPVSQSAGQQRPDKPEKARHACRPGVAQHQCGREQDHSRHFVGLFAREAQNQETFLDRIYVRTGVQIRVIKDARCIALMREFMRRHPALWAEDIGE